MSTPSKSAIPIAIVFMDPEADAESCMSVALSKTAIGFLATLTDFDIKAMAAEAALRLQRAIEMPPSPAEVDKLPPPP